MSPSEGERLATLEAEHAMMKEGMKTFAKKQDMQSSMLGDINTNLASINASIKPLVDERRTQVSRWKDPNLYVALIAVSTALFVALK